MKNRHGFLAKHHYVLCRRWERGGIKFCSAVNISFSSWLKSNVTLYDVISEHWYWHLLSLFSRGWWKIFGSYILSKTIKYYNTPQPLMQVREGETRIVYATSHRNVTWSNKCICVYVGNVHAKLPYTFSKCHCIYVLTNVLKSLFWLLMIG